MCIKYLKSSIGRKFVMALTGVFLLAFVVAHMLGNLQIYLGPEALNDYAEHLENLPLLLWPARIFLLVTLLIHMTAAVSLAIENKRARPIPYQTQNTAQASYASRTLVMSGLIIFTFIIYHLMNFTFDVTHPQYSLLLDSQGRDDVYSMVILTFKDPTVSLTYIVAMIFLYLHLSHGIASLFQSLGINNQVWQPRLKKIGYTLAVVIFIGNTSIPVAAMMGWIRPLVGV